MPYTYDWTVRLQDVDSFGMIFYSRPLEAFQAAIEDLFEDAGYEYHRQISDDHWSLPVVQAEIEYNHKLGFGDSVEIAVTPVFGERSITFTGRGTHDGKVVFTVERTQAVLDHESDETIPIPESLAEVLKPYTA